MSKSESLLLKQNEKGCIRKDTAFLILFSVFHALQHKEREGLDIFQQGIVDIAAAEEGIFEVIIRGRGRGGDPLAVRIAHHVFEADTEVIGQFLQFLQLWSAAAAFPVAEGRLRDPSIHRYTVGRQTTFFHQFCKDLIHDVLHLSNAFGNKNIRGRYCHLTALVYNKTEVLVKVRKNICVLNYSKAQVRKYGIRLLYRLLPFTPVWRMIWIIRNQNWGVYMNIIEIIDQKYGKLTRKQKLIADYMRSHAADMCFMTLKELSERAAVSEMTVLKLCSLLELGSYNEVKQAFRDLQAEQPADGGDPLSALAAEGLAEDSSGLFGQVCREELEGVNDFLRAFSIEEYRKAARMICRARAVLLLGSGVSVQMAGYLHSRLVECGVACLLVDARREEEVQSALHMIGSELLVVPMSFPEYPPLVNRVVRYAREEGAALLGVTDSTRSELAVMCDMCLYCPSYNHLYPDSQTTAVLAANLLSMAVRLEQDSTGGGAQAAIAINRVFEDL